jgi:hypothetical protein
MSGELLKETFDSLHPEPFQGIRRTGQQTTSLSSGDMLTNLAAYADLADRLRDASAEVDCVKEKMKELEGPILEAMKTADMDSAHIKGLTVYRRTDHYVSKRGGVDTQDVCDLLKKHGLEYLVKDGYSGSALKAKIREWQEEGTNIPVSLLTCPQHRRDCAACHPQELNHISPPAMCVRTAPTPEGETHESEVDVSGKFIKATELEDDLTPDDRVV